MGRMARKSRKRTKALHPVTSESLTFKSKTGIYVRLSVEDNGDTANDSIQNQITYLKEYVKNNEDDFQLVHIYVDNGTTGTNFDRAGWQKLIEDIKAGTINCVVFKDFSRIGRNYIEVGNYLEKIFPFLGVRVVSVNDGFDSKEQSFESNMLMNSLTNIVNDYYAKDISRKILQAKKMMQENGEYTSGIYPYGYKKADADRRKLAIDPEAADVVKKIFEWRIQKKSCAWIANTLNELAIPSPGLYKFLKGEQAYKHCCNAKWRSEYISKILKNTVYLGHLVQGKTQRSHFKNGGKRYNVPETDWVVSENTHEALVSQKQFNEAADMAAESHKRYCERKEANVDVPHIENPLRRKIYCGQCGHMMYRRSWIVKGIRNYYYYCDSRRRVLGVQCSQAGIQEKALMETIKDVTSHQLQLFVDVLDQWRKQRKFEGGCNNCRQEDKEVGLQNKERKEQLEQEILLIKRKRKEIYEDMKEGRLTQEDFENERKPLAETQLRYEKELKRKEDNNMEKEMVETLSIVKPDDSDIPLGLLGHLIEKIVVFSSEQINITYAFTDMLKEWSEEMQIRFPDIIEGDGGE